MLDVSPITHMRDQMMFGRQLADDTDCGGSDDAGLDAETDERAFRLNAAERWAEAAV